MNHLGDLGHDLISGDSVEDRPIGAGVTIRYVNGILLPSARSGPLDTRLHAIVATHAEAMLQAEGHWPNDGKRQRTALAHRAAELIARAKDTAVPTTAYPATWHGPIQEMRAEIMRIYLRMQQQRQAVAAAFADRVV